MVKCIGMNSTRASGGCLNIKRSKRWGGMMMARDGLKWSLLFVISQDEQDRRIQ